MPIILSAPAKRKNGRAPSVSALASKVIRLAEKHGANHPLTVAARADFEAAAQSKERSRQAGMSEEAQVWSHVLSHKNPRRRKNTRKTALPMADIKAIVLEYAGAGYGPLSDNVTGSIARDPRLRGVHFARIMSAVNALEKAGKVTYSGGVVTIRKNARKPALPPMRNNGSRSVVDTVAARELELYIENERNLVGPGNTMGANIMRMLAGRIVRGTYDSTKAWKAWSPLVTEGAKRYKREHGPLNASKATRDAVATRLSEAFEAEVRVGALDPMKLLGARNNPSGSEIVPPLAQWKKGDYEYSVRGRKGHGNTEYVIRNFSSTGSAWVPLALYANGNMSVVHKGVTGTHFVLTTENALSHKYSLYDYATPGAARAALVKAVNSSILPHARSSRR